MPTLSRRTAGGSKHLGHLDALRGIAILLVIIVHSYLTAGKSLPRVLTANLLSGQRGVELFYVVSAFTLFYTNRLSRNERHPIRNFYLRRFFRIAPLFYVAVILNLLVFGLGQLHPYHVLLGLLFLHGGSPAAINTVAFGGWSVAVESTFYVVLPLFFRYIRNVLTATYLLLGSMFVGWVSAYLLTRTSTSLEMNQYFAFLWFPVQLPVFALGILAYFLSQSLAPETPAQHHETRGLSFCFITVAALIWIGSINPYSVPDAKWQWSDSHIYIASLAFVPFLIGLSLHPFPLFDNAITRFMGKISYSVYLLHFYVLKAIAQLMIYTVKLGPLRIHITVFPGMRGVLQVLIFVLLGSVPICTLSWLFIEQPGIRLGRKLIDKLENRHRQMVSPTLTSLPSTPEQQF